MERNKEKIRIVKEIHLKNKENRAYREYDIEVKSNSGKNFRIEKNKFRDFHVHKATQRYPEAGFRIDGYAEVTDSYKNWKDAFMKMLQDCNFKGDIIFLSNFN